SVTIWSFATLSIPAGLTVVTSGDSRAVAVLAATQGLTVLGDIRLSGQGGQNGSPYRDGSDSPSSDGGGGGGAIMPGTGGGGGGGAGGTILVSGDTVTYGSACTLNASGGKAGAGSGSGGNGGQGADGRVYIAAGITTGMPTILPMVTHEQAPLSAFPAPR